MRIQLRSLWVLRHPDEVKTVLLIYVLDSEDDTTTYPNDIFNYSRATKNTDLSAGTNDTFSLLIQINNNNRFERTDATFFRTMQPYNIILILKFVF